MIKFFKDEYANLSALNGNTNAICFATDRHVILLGGQEYGKDQVKVVATSADIATASASIGTIFFVTGDQSVYQKTSGTPSVIINPVLSSANLLSADDANGVTVFTTAGSSDSYIATAGDVATAVSHLEGKISSAYEADKVVVGTSAGITATDFVIDTTSGDLALTGSNLSTTLVNAATLKAQVDDLSSSKATLTAGSGISVTSASNDGIEWTISATVSDAETNSIGFDSNGKLTDNLILSAVATESGYAASYALFNTKSGTPVQLGDTINIVKDQFLNGAELVTGHMDGNTFVPGAAATDHKFVKLSFNVNTDDDSTDAESGANSDIYLDVNDLVDVYTAGDGIDVTSANVISIKKDANAESFLTVSSAGILLSGVQDAIDEAASGAISGLSSYAAGTDEFITAIGVDANGKLTGTAAQPAASGVTFEAITSSANNVAVTGSDVQAAISSLATTITTTVSSLSAAEVGGTGKYITSISETNGIISATADDLDASKVAYGDSSDVSAALDSINDTLSNLSSVLSSLDFGPTASGAAPASGNTTKYTIINTVEQTDGKLSATTLDLTAENTYLSGISTTATGASGVVRVGITQGSVQDGFDQVSNYLADYLSFHNASGEVI